MCQCNVRCLLEVFLSNLHVQWRPTSFLLVYRLHTSLFKWKKRSSDGVILKGCLINRALLRRRIILFFVILVESLLLRLITSRRRIRRSIWMNQRHSVWWERMLKDGSDADWRENFRMSRSTFKQSVNLLHSDIVFGL